MSEENDTVSMSGLFPEMLGYYFEKIGDAVQGHKPAEFGALHVQLVMDIAAKYNARLDAFGGRRANPGSDICLQELEYPLVELYRYFADNQQSHLNRQDAELFRFYIRAKLDSLRQMAGEIDATR